jgi:cytochrome P450
MELLRFENASKFTMRYSHEEVAIGGQVIPPGQMVFISLHGANWDTAVYKDPEVLDFNRDTRKSTVFGSGEYYCLGAHLAKLQMKTVLRYLLDHLPMTATCHRR